MSRLIEVGKQAACALGLTERIIDIPTAVDFSVTNSISIDQLNMEIASMAGDISTEFEEMWGEQADQVRQAAQLNGGSDGAGDAEFCINTIKRDMFIAKAKVELVLLRGLDETFVNDQINNMFADNAMRVQL